MSIVCEKLVIKNGDKTVLNISLEIEKSLALIGQSGSGKSLTLKAFLDMLPSNLDSDMQVTCDYELIRGKTISIIPQNPFTALSPLTKIKNQFFISDELMLNYINLVGLDKKIVDRFPSELSGGQLQRVIIAMALSVKPKLLLLDEPTTALDKKSKADILDLLKNLQSIDGFDMLFVTHDVSTVEELCDRVGILKDGKIVEEGDMYEVLKNPKNPYTKKLINSGFKNREFRK